jgi:hypothetical protein
MTNLELIKSFNRGVKKGHSGGRDSDTKKYNLRIEGDNLVNYSTIIAKRGLNGAIVLNKKKYSQTTSIIQNKIRQYCNVVEEVEGF